MCDEFSAMRENKTRTQGGYRKVCGAKKVEVEWAGGEERQREKDRDRINGFGAEDTLVNDMSLLHSLSFCFSFCPNRSVALPNSLSLYIPESLG